MGYTGPTVASPESGNAAFWSYGYVPSLALGVIGVITFIAVAGPHLWFFVKIRGTRSVHGLLFFTAVIEALGYGARIYTHRKPFGGMSFLLGIFLIQIATVLLTAAMYKSVQRLTKYTPEGRHMSPMRPRSMLVLFVILDVMSTLVFLAGNVLQAITIIIVSIFVFVIYRRSTRIINTALANNKDVDNYPLIHPALTQVLITFGLFFVRLIMRIAEGAQGAYEYAATHEVFFAIFEYLPIILILILWAARPLKNFLPLNQTTTTTSTHEDVERTAELGRSESQVEGEKA
ncbi:hypothetical protein L198_05687 [Cryptococcus wingfieldii CBS 7118]|uniref:Uncharacterized protein n=1 Tax=Cryptococcus wingfieldii CBS 7118 TaxID=1295528 RepID=A0A1E3IU93_9TREE|nr:hypothetical protein L198_05687 [Cryptococcus wingfieldii CBS 7118]ODN92015.1 hypothetical protein L198_05687 [Cryptococcus wingfieldii CBS 7118]